MPARSEVHRGLFQRPVEGMHAGIERQERERQHPVHVSHHHRRPEREADIEIAKEHQQHDAADDPRHDDRQQHQVEDDRLERKVAAKGERQSQRQNGRDRAGHETDADAVEQRTEELRRVQNLRVPDRQ